MPDRLVGQGLRFAVVGAAATMTHVVAALAFGEGAGWSPGQANLAGWALAAVLSYAGHARYTFGVSRDHGRRVPRFLAVSLLGVATSAAITHLICGVLDRSLAAAMVVVVCIVPATSFGANRLWVFREPRRRHGAVFTASKPA